MAATHYSNLKVAENAPVEVIRAAYKALALQFHPDNNPGEPRAVAVMQMLNAAYHVLSDTESRRKYDERLRHYRAAVLQPSTTITAAPPEKQPEPPMPVAVKQECNSPNHSVFVFKVVGGAALAFLILTKFLGGFDKSITESSAPITLPRAINPSTSPPPLSAQLEAARAALEEEYRKTQLQKPPPGLTASTPPPKPKFQRPTKTPDGSPWPSTASYVSGYGRYRANGLSQLTIDNTQHDVDVFAMVVDPGTTECIRACHIPKGEKFLLTELTSGTYDVRYRDLVSGELYKTDPFTLREIPGYRSTQYSTVTLTIYKVVNGNMETVEIDESQFPE